MFSVVTSATSHLSPTFSILITALAKAHPHGPGSIMCTPFVTSLYFEWACAAKITEYSGQASAMAIEPS